MNMQRPSRMLPSVLDTALELHDAAGGLSALEAEQKAIRDQVEAMFDAIRDRALRFRDANEANHLMMIDIVEQG